MSDYDHDARPECTALITADLRVPSLPKGECIVTRLDDGRLRIDHADYRITECLSWYFGYIAEWPD